MKNLALAGATRPTDRNVHSIKGIMLLKVAPVFAIAAFVVIALLVLPGFAPQVQAREPLPLTKGDRNEIAASEATCLKQAWPNFEHGCLYRAGSDSSVRAARLVGIERR